MWTSRSRVAVVAAFIVPSLLVVLAGTSFLTVSIVYAILFVEGDILTLLAIGWTRSTIGGARQRRLEDDGGGFMRTSRVDALTATIRSAEYGSDYSRREIAESIDELVDHVRGRSVEPEEGAKVSEGGEGDGLDRALDVAVRPYLERRSPVTSSRSDSGGSGRSTKDARRPTRGRYISSLETIVTHIEKEMREGAPARRGNAT